MAADSSFDGAIFDSPKSSKLTMQEKRELVYEISKSHGASETLQSWSRQDILQVLCAEMGKERKYTGLTKQKIIEHLLRLISEKKSSVPDVLKNLEPQSPAGGHKNTKRQRKSEHLAQLSVPANDFPTSSSHNDLGHMACCKNLACRATLSPEDAFCRRCSCCICRQYDDNKDPSLWISCSAEPPFQGDSCNMSCHLECALKDERSGISKAGRSRGIDGSFYCVSCGKLNDLLGCCRKQLVHAKDTRRVDILCYRVSLSQKLLHRTEKYKVLYQIVDESVRKLEAEVGPIAGVPVKMGRGIVNRLSSGPEVQKLCASAIELLDSMISSNSLHLSPNPDIQDANFVPANMVRFEDVQSTSLTLVLSCENGSSENQVGFTLWHRKADDADYPAEPTCILRQPKARCAVMGLSPATKYHFKIVQFEGTRELREFEVQFSTIREVEENPGCLEIERSQSHATNCSDLSNPSSVEDETTDILPYGDRTDNLGKNSTAYSKGTEMLSSAILSTDAFNLSDNGEEGTPAGTVSVLDEANATGMVGLIPSSVASKLENRHGPTAPKLNTDNQLNALVRSGMERQPFVGCSSDGLPITPCKLEVLKDSLGRGERPKSGCKDLDNRTRKGGEPQDGSTSKMRTGERQDDKCAENGVSDRDFEHYVKVIRWLECEGHIEKNFRQKFLTWYSLRASQQEVKIVKVFVDTFIEDPASLAEQLVDTFSECISSKKPTTMPPGFCMKLWH